MPGQDHRTGARRRVAGTRRAPRWRRPVHLAPVGLVLVLLVLTVFSVTAAVTNARAAQRAQVSAEVSRYSEEALAQLVLEENLMDELKDPGPEADGEDWADYAAARAGVTAALRELRTSVTPDRRHQVDMWLALHARYGDEVDTLLSLGRLAPERAEEHEEESLDPYYDPLEAGLKGVVQRHLTESHQALTANVRLQRALLLATPVVFGLGLALVVAFSTVLVRGRRTVAAQAEENRHQALHDALTGLPNRTLLRQRLEEALATAQVTGVPAALLLVDLNRFKEINDTLGHGYGDLVLRVVADRLRAALGPTATVARLGGDEFAILLPDVGDADRALRIALAVQESTDASIDADSISLDVDASIGVVVSGEHGDDVETLLRHADIAMYRAKERGQGVCVYDDDLNDHSREQLGLLGELRRAIDSDELVLQFQPKVTLPGGTFCGAEALVRWQHPERGLLPPGLFVPVAERTALIHPLTRWVVDAALAECRRWQDEGRRLHVAVNVSVRNLLDDAFLDDVADALRRWRVPASCLELEVTESAVMADPDRARTVLRAFAELGVTLSIDDFGAGYTSLGHLATLPVHTLKIDRSLVSRMTSRPADAFIVRSVVDLAHSLGLRTVAEGVEDVVTSDMLRTMACDVAQGYLIARPMAADRLVDWCADAAAVAAAGEVVLSAAARPA